jgi:hypothetical protein
MSYAFAASLRVVSDYLSQQAIHGALSRSALVSAMRDSGSGVWRVSFAK